MDDDSRDVALDWASWNVAWRFVVILAIAGMWFSPDGLHYQAKHFALYLFLQMLIAGVGFGLAPIAAVIELVDLVRIFRRHVAGTIWIKLRLVWLVVVCIHLTAVVIALKLQYRSV